MLVSVFSTFSLCVALEVILLICGVKVMCVSSVMPNIVGVLFRGMIAPERRICGCILDSWHLSGVNKVMEDFWGEADILLL